MTNKEQQIKDLQVKIKKLSVLLNSLLLVRGIKGMQECYSNLIRDFYSASAIQTAIKQRIRRIPVIEKDLIYFTTTEQNWRILLSLIYNNIIKAFKWRREYADCDDRAKFVCALISFLFTLNASAQVYCEVSGFGGWRGRHYCNLVVTSEKKVLLFDVDNGGRIKEVVGDNMTMGGVRYKFFKVIF